jgi:uncharacterized protein (DUF2384 family)
MASQAAPSQAITRLGHAMDLVDIDATGVARIVDKDPKTVSRWLRHQTEPRWEAREMLLALGVVLERLAQVMERGAAEDWLFTPVPLLDYQRPVDLLRRGEYRPVLGLVDAIGEGVFT